MELTPEALTLGRRNFLKAIAGTSTLAVLGVTAAVRGPIRGGPVRTALVGYGKQGRKLQGSIDPNIMDLVAICDIKPTQKFGGQDAAGIHWYQDWRQLLQKENIDAVIIATPLNTHAEIAVAFLQAGKHVFCETAMASDANACREMIEASEKNERILAVGYQDFYEPLYWAAYQHIMKQGLLGDVYTVEAAWHSSDSGRIANEPNPTNFDPSPWGYPSWDELVNWRLYRPFSDGPMAEWGGALVSMTNWFLESKPLAVQATGGNFSYKDGRQVADQIYATLEYPNGRTMTLSVLQSNSFEGSYVQFMGTKGTLIVGKGEALLFPESDSKVSAVTATKVDPAHPIMDTSASLGLEASSRPVSSGGSGDASGTAAFHEELAAFCGSIRTGNAFRSDAARAYDTALTCFAINEAIQLKQRLNLDGAQANPQIRSANAEIGRHQYA